MERQRLWRAVDPDLFRFTTTICEMFAELADLLAAPRSGKTDAP